MLPQTRILLQQVYKPFNILLADLLQQPSYMSWNTPAENGKYPRFWVAVYFENKHVCFIHLTYHGQ